jgi:AcrR family transcriptional regulator
MHEDRRVRRTRDLLRRSLIALILEKGYERITVQDILDHADIGRSTFYTHYQGKDDLLLSGFDELRYEFLDAVARNPDDVLGPTRALFDHVDGHRALYRAMAGRRGHDLAMRSIRRELTTILTDHLRHRVTVDGDALDATVAFLISGLTGTLTWWLDTEASLSSDAMYDRFEHLARNGIEPLLTRPQVHGGD